jgi:hypothetical protein
MKLLQMSFVQAFSANKFNSSSSLLIDFSQAQLQVVLFQTKKYWTLAELELPANQKLLEVAAKAIWTILPF